MSNERVKSEKPAVTRWAMEAACEIELYGPDTHREHLAEIVERAIDAAVKPVDADLIRVLRAINQYADLAPFDLMKPRGVIEDLRAIAGEPHIHRAGIGTDECLICCQDLRADIHRGTNRPKR